MYNYMAELGLPYTFEQGEKSDLFFDVQLIRRGKDHPNLPATNYTFKTYYIKCLEEFERRWEEMVTCCDIFQLRAYISVNAKSKEEAAKKTCEKYAHNIVTNDYRTPWKSFSSVCGGLDGKEKRWVVDVDCDDVHYFNTVLECIRKCESKYTDPYVCSLKTKSGFHIITHPFNLQKFNELCKSENIELPDVKKNHLTLLYENLK